MGDLTLSRIFNPPSSRIIMKIGILLSTALIFTGFIAPEAFASGVCGKKAPEASFETTKHLVTICPGEASFQMIITYHDGSGYVRVPATSEGNKFRGSDDEHNYIIDSRKFIIGTDGEEPITENVTSSR